MLTMEFGNPSLYIREPIEPRSATSPKVIALLRRRIVAAVGEWDIEIFLCRWRCVVSGDEIARWTSSDRRVSATAHLLNGQRLMSVVVDPDRGRSSFTFDLGAVLETWPSGEGLIEQWYLHHRPRPDFGHTFAYHRDGRYSWSAPDVRRGEEVWLPLPAGKTHAAA